MTGTIEFETVAEALALIDQGLGTMQNRNLVSTDEVSDLLLDVRMILAAAESTTLAGDAADTPIAPLEPAVTS